MPEKVTKIKTFEIQWMGSTLSVDIAKNGKFILAISAGEDLYGIEYFKELTAPIEDYFRLLDEIVQVLGNEIFESREAARIADDVISSLNSQIKQLGDAIYKASN